MTPFKQEQSRALKFGEFLKSLSEPKRSHIQDNRKDEAR